MKLHCTRTSRYTFKGPSSLSGLLRYPQNQSEVKIIVQIITRRNLQPQMCLLIIFINTVRTRNRNCIHIEHARLPIPICTSRAVIH